MNPNEVTMTAGACLARPQIGVALVVGGVALRESEAAE